MKIGIYYLRDTLKGRLYIGSSKDLTGRFKRHRRELLSGKHHNIYLQRFCNKYGHDKIEYGVIKFLDQPKNLFEKESFWIGKLKPEFNIDSVAGGDNFTNHPDKERIRKIHSDNLKKLREAGKVPKTGSGDKNPNWRGGVAGKNLCVCGKEKKFKSKFCKVCSDNSRIGDSNPFFGKSHSEDTKDKIRKLKSGKPNTGAMKPLMAEGQVFSSNKEAAKYFNVVAGTITHRCKSESEEWREWYYISP